MSVSCHIVANCLTPVTYISASGPGSYHTIEVPFVGLTISDEFHYECVQEWNGQFPGKVLGGYRLLSDAEVTDFRRLRDAFDALNAAKAAFEKAKVEFWETTAGMEAKKYLHPTPDVVAELDYSDLLSEMSEHGEVSNVKCEKDSDTTYAIKFTLQSKEYIMKKGPPRNPCGGKYHCGCSLSYTTEPDKDGFYFVRMFYVFGKQYPEYRCTDAELLCSGETPTGTLAEQFAKEQSELLERHGINKSDVHSVR